MSKQLAPSLHIQNAPTVTDYLDELTHRKQQQIRKATVEEAFDAAVTDIYQNGIPPGYRPDSGYIGFKKRRYNKNKPQSSQK